MPRFLFSFALEKESTSVLARLHPCSMLIAVACMTVMVFSTSNWLVLLSLLVFLFLVVILDHLPIRDTLSVMIVILPLCFFITLLQALTRTTNIVAHFNLVGVGILVSLDGVLLGLVVTLRVALMALAVIILFTVVNPVKLTRALYELGTGFKFAYIFTLALRFLPLVLEDLATINNAQKSRGYDIDRVNLALKVFKMFPLAIPLILGALKRSNSIALAMDLKAFDAYPQRTFFVSVQKGRADVVMRAVSMAAAVIFILANLRGAL